MRWFALATLAALAGCDLVFTVPDREGPPDPTSCSVLLDAAFPPGTTCSPGNQFGVGTVVQSGGMLVIRSSAANSCGCGYDFHTPLQQVAFQLTREASGADAKTGMQVVNSFDGAIYIVNNELVFGNTTGTVVFGMTPYDPKKRWARMVFYGDKTTAELSSDGVSWSVFGDTPLTPGDDLTVNLIVSFGTSVTGDTATFARFIACSP